jgi:hypothetical protein
VRFCSLTTCLRILANMSPPENEGIHEDGSGSLLTKTLEKVRTEMSLQVLACNLKRKIAIVGVKPLIETMRGPENPRAIALRPTVTSK